MDELHRFAEKLTRDVRHMERVLDSADADEETRLALSLSIAKRVRRDSTLLVRAIAAAIDATANGGTSE